MAQNLVATCVSHEQKQKTEIFVNSKGLKELFTGVKSINGHLLLVEEDIVLPTTMRKAKGANIDMPLVNMNSNYLGNWLNFNLNLGIPTSQKVFVEQSYGGKDYSYEMTCELSEI